MQALDSVLVEAQAVASMEVEADTRAQGQREASKQGLTDKEDPPSTLDKELQSVMIRTHS